jgi:hypothetical protein
MHRRVLSKRNEHRERVSLFGLSITPMWKCVLKFHVYLDVQYLDIAVYPISDAKRYQNQVTESDTRRHGTGLIYIVFGSIENEQCMCSLHMTT